MGSHLAGGYAGKKTRTRAGGQADQGQSGSYSSTMALTLETLPWDVFHHHILPASRMISMHSLYQTSTALHACVSRYVRTYMHTQGEARFERYGSTTRVKEHETIPVGRLLVWSKDWVWGFYNCFSPALLRAYGDAFVCGRLVHSTLDMDQVLTQLVGGLIMALGADMPDHLLMAQFSTLTQRGILPRAALALPLKDRHNVWFMALLASPQKRGRMLRIWSTSEPDWLKANAVRVLDMAVKSGKPARFQWIHEQSRCRNGCVCRLRELSDGTLLAMLAVPHMAAYWAEAMQLDHVTYRLSRLSNAPTSWLDNALCVFSVPDMVKTWFPVGYPTLGQWLLDKHGASLVVNGAFTQNIEMARRLGHGKMDNTTCTCALCALLLRP